MTRPSTMSHPGLDLVGALQTASQGLQWMSESDYPFEVIHWPSTNLTNLTQEALLQRTGHSADTAVSTQDVDRFFAPALEAQDWYGPEELATLQQYRKLVATLKQYLQNLTVYRVGEVEVDIYILGQATDGVAGLATQAVET